MTTRRHDSVLVTGAAGFVGGHLVDLLCREGERVVAWSRPPTAPPHLARATADGSVRWMGVDLLDADAVQAALDLVNPDVVYHCAGAAHVGDAWASATDTLRANVLGTHTLLEAARRRGRAPRILVPGSALIYGPSDKPISEDAPLRPTGPYGVSKMAQELLCARAVAAGRAAVVMTRSFNHVGPRQRASYAASGFARQIAEIEAGGKPRVLRVGNLEARRDLTDVRDTVRAYRLLVARGSPGRAYNVCSGRAYSMREILDRLLQHSRVPLSVEVDPARLRPNDRALVVGDSARLRTETGWTPRIDVDETLADLLDYWRAQVAASSA